MNDRLRDLVARGLRKQARDRAIHTAAGGYLATSCLHGQHGYCQGDTGCAGTKIPAQCKFCGLPCSCPCHKERNNEGEHEDPV